MSQNKITSPSSLNPTDSVDLAVILNFGALADTYLYIDSSGTLAIGVRQTLNDRQNEGAALTVVDHYLEFPFEVRLGKAKVKTTVNALLNAMGKPSLPCSSIEVTSIVVRDINGAPFATAGIFLPYP